MPEIKLQKKLIYAGDVLMEILKEDPKLVYILDRIKPVDAVEVVHGRWILIRKGYNTSAYQCSKCKRMVAVGCDEHLREQQLAKNYPYCNCGAKMDGGKRQ